MSYTNNIEAVKDGLQTLIHAEFLPNGVPLVFAKGYQREYLKHGEYIRYFIEEDIFLGAHSDGEHREYEFEISMYFNIKARNVDRDFDIWASEESERLKRLLNDNRSYTLSGASVWHHLYIDSPGYLQDLIIIEDFEEEEEEGLEHIKVIQHTVKIYRSNFN